MVGRKLMRSCLELDRMGVLKGREVKEQPKDPVKIETNCEAVGLEASSN